MIILTIMISFYILLKLIRDIYLFPPIPYTSVLIVLNQECILNILGVFFQSLLYFQNASSPEILQFVL